MEFEDNATQDAITTRSEASQGPHETAERARPSRYRFTKRNDVKGKIQKAVKIESAEEKQWKAGKIPQPAPMDTVEEETAGERGEGEETTMQKVHCFNI